MMSSGSHDNCADNRRVIANPHAVKRQRSVLFSINRAASAGIESACRGVTKLKSRVSQIQRAARFD